MISIVEPWWPLIHWSFWLLDCSQNLFLSECSNSDRTAQSSTCDFEQKKIYSQVDFLFIGPESDLWEYLSLTHWLSHSCLVNLIDVTLACEDDNSNLLRLFLLFMLMMRNVLTTVWCRCGRWSLVIKLSFCSDFEDKVSRFGQDFEVDFQARFWSWSLVIILLLMLGCGYEVQSWSRFWS